MQYCWRKCTNRCKMVMMELKDKLTPGVWSALCMAMLVLWVAEGEETRSLGQAGESCFANATCLDSKLVCQFNSTCRIKKGELCSKESERDKCQFSTLCVLSCPCCSVPEFFCSYKPGLVEGCGLSVLMAIVVFLGALLITGLAFYLILERLDG